MSKIVSIAHTHLENSIQIDDEYVVVLVEENPKEFYDVVQDFIKQFNGEDGEFVFSQESKFIKPEKIGFMISDIFGFDINDKKMLNLLYKKLEKSAYDSEMIKPLNDINSSIIKYLDEMIYKENLSLSYEEVLPIDVFKVSSLKFESSFESLEEKIICFINAVVELKLCKFFIFINLKSVLPVEAVKELYKHCQREKIGLLLIESADRYHLPEEKTIIITEDLCEIVVNYDK